MIINYNTITGKQKHLEIPDHAYSIRKEWGGWFADNGVYLWWKEYGNDRCKKLVATKWKANLDIINISVNNRPFEKSEQEHN